MNFDEIIERRGTHCMKWDMMESLYGVPTDDGIAMWVADMDFRPPEVARRALQRLLDHGIFGYYGDDRAYREAIAWWMMHRHGWKVEPEWIFTTHGLVNGTAMCIDAYSRPGDHVVLFTPVYHAFARIIRAAGRGITECRLEQVGGRYRFDFDSYSRLMTGREKIAILCSPQNPGGTVWSSAELRQFAEFCRSHDLILVADEIHHDLLMPGSQHTVMHLADPEIGDRLIMMTATTKTFNLAGAHVGNVIIPDPALRDRFAGRMAGLGMSPNSFGLFLAEAVYSSEGAEWVDQAMDYIHKNSLLFDGVVGGIDGANSMKLDATYLAWVDFRGTGLAEQEVSDRIERQARIAVNHGQTFGAGGAGHCRFNLATPRPLLETALERLQDAFATG